MIEVGNIVTLQNDQEYLILEELVKSVSEYIKRKYVYTVRVLEDETPTDEFVIFEALKNEEDEYLIPVDDKKLYDELIEDFKDVLADKIIDLDNKNEEN